MQIDNDIIKNAIAYTLKQYRVEADLTQAQLAEKAHISTEFLQDIEYSRSGVSIATLINLCNALSITPNDILRKFLSTNNVDDDNLTQQIKLLSNHEKNAIYTLVQYYNNNCD